MSEELTDDSLKLLYRFRSLNEGDVSFTERIITHNELYFCSASRFNDPFDCMPAYDLDSTPEEREQYIQALFGRTLSHLPHEERSRLVADAMRGFGSENKQAETENFLTKGMRDAIEGRGICCFSEDWSHILMWSHYAANHSGICLGFEATSFTPFFGRAQKVEYSESYPLVNPIKQSKLERARRLLFTKAKHWEYEKEWRIVDFDVPGSGIRIFPSQLLQVVILGMRITRDKEELVRAWVSGRERKPRILRATAKQGKYGLDLQPVHWF